MVHSVPDYDDRALLDPEEAEVKISKKELYQMLLGKLIDVELEEEAMQEERLSSSVDERPSEEVYLADQDITDMTG